ncbi:hypothetical protein PTTG_03941 [Puccinia triticina 1-1 BBBD Race 1]|uniref:Mitoc_mL59 domain-containing protein n=2 Tax=Puccinia triticina TaxID=208348 RepID=A0A0C4ET12_PUCT1|nr:uncharacterized protein PtA15_14A463 [Puccinia triticina]OAV92295.1 hypothetical protein PTTG_03941 [Puccinia triticina 1-1 BBBD Race 1]WAQ91579.1 hypothetical protein PtA15_14A463 [Puccinia triticina]WAR62384.1 hypothetical protein PtB15_14B479 [Puccinia triticina]
MLSSSAPTARIANSSRLLKQSNQFISPHSLLLRTRSAVQQRARKTRTTRPSRSPSLLAILTQHTASKPPSSSPFLPTKFRSEHSNPAIDPAKVRWRPPLLKAQARAMICKQAFHWRILRYIFNLSADALDPQKTPRESLPRSTRNLLAQKPNFYDGSLTLHEFAQIPADPVPRLVELLGGPERLSVKDKRLLGLFQAPKDIAKPVSSTTTPAEPHQDQPIRSNPRYSTPTLIPQAFGPYIGRRKPFKGKIRERHREAKVAEVTQKMVKMDDRIQTYRKEWRVVKEKSKPALPF